VNDVAGSRVPFVRSRVVGAVAGTLLASCSAARPPQAPSAAPPVDSPSAAKPRLRGLAPDEIRTVVTAHRGALQACYTIEASSVPGMRGTVTMHWRVGGPGAVVEASVLSTTLSNPRVESCLLRQIRSWQFPATDTGAEVAFPFAFGIGQ
jgi:hypothetical protein